MARYELTAAAAQDARRIAEFTGETWSLEQAFDYVDALYDAFEMLAEFPSPGRPALGHVPDLRAKPARAHVIYHREMADRVVIVRVLHAAQDPDAAFPAGYES